MFKKSLINLLFVIFIIFSFGINNTIAADTTVEKSYSEQPKLNCIGLPGCVDDKITEPTKPSETKNIGIEVISNIIGNLIQFVGVVAVISLILSGIMYLISGGEEEKAKTAKTWIIWSLVGVLLSVSAWGIISMLNEISIG